MARVTLVVFTMIVAAGAQTPRPASAPDPSKDELALPALASWNASLVYEGDVGIWTVGSFPLQQLYGMPEIVGLDDKGRCTILMGYSGKWTPYQTVEDREWLGGISHIDLDPKRPGAELYTGGKRGNLYQIVPHPGGGADTALIARFPAEEIHTLVGGELRTDRPGNELLCFTHEGNVYDVRPTEGALHGLAAHLVAKLPGRLREGVLFPPAEKGQGSRIAAVLRSGDVVLLSFDAKGVQAQTILKEPMGFGRIARRCPAPETPEVLYVTRDDGVVLRLEQQADGFAREMIYAGPQGPRGLCAGRFHEDPTRETVAVFGYGKRVQLLSRSPGGAWEVEDIFVDRDKGHWLAAAELDGRNSTDEIIGSGYGARIFLLARPPGYGLNKVPFDRPAKEKASSETRPMRVGIVAGLAAVQEISTLRYGGGFESKTLVFDTLVKRSSEGAIVPGIAASWKSEDEGRQWTFTLPPGARFHDGTPLSASAVEEHFRRVIGLPEHAWLPALRRVVRVSSEGEVTVRFHANEPTSILGDLCAINPCAVRAPTTLDRQGAFLKPVGSGPYRFEGLREDGRVLRYVRLKGGATSVDLVRLENEQATAAALRSGEIDLAFNGWTEMLRPDEVKALAMDSRFRVISKPGSSVVHLDFQCLRGPTADRLLRLRIASVLNREELIAKIENGRAEAATGWCAPSLLVWPKARPGGSVEAEATPALQRPLQILASVQDRRHSAVAKLVAEQLSAAGIPAEPLLLPGYELEAHRLEGEFSMQVSSSWGLPYDPDLSLAARYLPPPDRKAAATASQGGVDRRLSSLVFRLTEITEDAARSKLYAEIQSLIDEEAFVIPLYSPHRLAILRATFKDPDFHQDLYRFDPMPVTSRD